MAMDSAWLQNSFNQILIKCGSIFIYSHTKYLVYI